MSNDHNEGDITAKERELVFEALQNALDLLGWVVSPPDPGVMTKGLVIGTPEFIDAWNEAKTKQRKLLQ